MANPRNKRTAAQKAATKRMLAARAGHAKNPAVVTRTITRYKNRGKAKAGRRRNPRHSRNQFQVAGFGFKEMGIAAVGAFGGGLLTRKLTSIALGKIGHNEGIVGYGTNIGVAIGLGLLGAHLVSPVFGIGILAGGGGTIVQRFYDEHIGQLHKVVATAISGAPHDGKGMGDISYDQPAVAALEGYYESAYNARTLIGSEMGGGGGLSLAPISARGAFHPADAAVM
ncbi:MAG TPA: hypothetical protein VMQ76_12330 [Terracidiphilus sp.]|nr:hypothetical protein [Terracidiphilus sp.]